MISEVLILKVTFVALAGAVSYLMFRQASAAARHLLCAATLILSLVLPFLPEIRANNGFTIQLDVLRLSASSDSHQAGFWPLLLSAVWMVGVLVVLLRYAVGLFAAARLTSRSLRDESLSQEMNCEVRRADVAGPLVWGFFRPTILIPFDSVHWSKEHQRIALLHERIHILRRDAWFRALGHCASALYWFHPLIWWLTERMTEESELACDAAVLHAGVNPAEYAGVLVDTARGLSSPVIWGCSMIGRSTLRERVKRVLSASEERRSRFGSRTSLVSCVSMLVGIAFLVSAARAETIYKIGGDVQAPAVVHKVEPEYAPKSKQNKVQGTVLLTVVIGSDGKPRSIHVERSLAPDLDQQAKKAVATWRFQPAMKQGHPVAVRARVEVNFRLL